MGLEKLKQLKCDCCHNDFETSSNRWKQSRSRKKIYGELTYCSTKCRILGRGFSLTKEVKCLKCDSIFLKKGNDVTRSPNHFCKQSCAASYNNKNKTHGTRRSKLEAWLEEKLVNLYPNLEIHFNRKDAINSELDIYIPSLKLAVELNGIFHYESIYGSEKLEKIQNNDLIKIKICQSKNIELININTSIQKKFSEETSYMFLNEIINLINEKLVHQVRFELTKGFQTHAPL